MKKEVPTIANKEDILEQIRGFIELVRILRENCPWDSEQTHKSIAHLLLEEAYEVYDAIMKDDAAELSKELGDVFLHIIMHGVIAEEAGEFNLCDIVDSEFNKMVRRHPHIFGEVSAEKSEDVLMNWEKIKMTEGQKSVLEGVPASLPSLLKAQRMQEKASKVGFDWNNKADVWNKVEEEFSELKFEVLSGNKAGMEEELGDMIFSLVNLARFEGIVAEDALQRTNSKFKKRFQYIESQGGDLSKLTLEEMDVLWNEAKKLERM